MSSEPGEGKRRAPGGVTTTRRAASPCLHFPAGTFPFYFYFFGGGRGGGGQQQAGSFCASYRPELRGFLPARLACGVPPALPRGMPMGAGERARPPRSRRFQRGRGRGGRAAAPAPAHGESLPGGSFARSLFFFFFPFLSSPRPSRLISPSSSRDVK